MKMVQIWNIVGNFRWKWSKFGRLSEILDGDGLDSYFCWNKIQNFGEKTSKFTIFEE